MITEGIVESKRYRNNLPTFFSRNPLAGDIQCFFCDLFAVTWGWKGANVRDGKTLIHFMRWEKILWRLIRIESSQPTCVLPARIENCVIIIFRKYHFFWCDNKEGCERVVKINHEIEIDWNCGKTKKKWKMFED